MGRFKSNVLAEPHCHRPPRDSLDLDGRLSGSLAAFKFAISAGFGKNKIRFFSESFRTPSDSFISKNEGMAKAATRTFTSYSLPAFLAHSELGQEATLEKHFIWGQRRYA